MKKKAGEDATGSEIKLNLNIGILSHRVG